MRTNALKKYTGFAFTLLLPIIIYVIYPESGSSLVSNSKEFLFETMKIMPCAFILIGLFDVWVEKKSVQNKFTGIKGYFFAIILASSTIGGLYVAFPMGFALHEKGVRMKYILSYLFAAASFRIPMSIYEASFIGIEFTFLRFLITLPLIIIFSIVMERIINKFQLQKK